jgi:hypothetical protein
MKDEEFVYEKLYDIIAQILKQEQAKTLPKRNWHLGLELKNPTSVACRKRNFMHDFLASSPLSWKRGTGNLY